LVIISAFHSLPGAGKEKNRALHALITHGRCLPY
jgi:hypothetical protein